MRLKRLEFTIFEFCESKIALKSYSYFLINVASLQMLHVHVYIYIRKTMLSLSLDYVHSWIDEAIHKKAICR